MLTSCVVGGFCIGGIGYSDAALAVSGCSASVQIIVFTEWLAGQVVLWDARVDMRGSGACDGGDGVSAADQSGCQEKMEFVD